MSAMISAENWATQLANQIAVFWILQTYISTDVDGEADTIDHDAIADRLRDNVVRNGCGWVNGCIVHVSVYMYLYMYAYICIYK